MSPLFLLDLLEKMVAIYEYDGTESAPEKYLGLRVAVSISGKLHQKWFNFRMKGTEVSEMEKDLMRKQAERQEQQWKFEQQLNKEQYIRQRKEGNSYSAYKTGVRGIKMKFRKTEKRRGDKYYCHYSPVFIVSGSSQGQTYRKTISIKKHGYDFAWFKACQYAAQKYGISQYDHLIKLKPDVRQFHLIYNWQCKQGWDIPLTSLPDELKSKPPEKTSSFPAGFAKF